MMRSGYQARKEKLAEIAARVFCEKGFKEASLQDIALRGGSSKAGIYHYFKTKEDILSYILLNNTDKFMSALESCRTKCRGNGRDPESSLRELIHTYARFLIRAKMNSQLVLRERHQLTGENKRNLLKKERELFRLVKQEVSRVTHVNKKFDLSVISFLIISMCHWMGYWLKERGGLKQEEAINQNIEIIFGGMRKH
jgi:AcrR family transcriptional regulator